MPECAATPVAPALLALLGKVVHGRKILTGIRMTAGIIRIGGTGKIGGERRRAVRCEL